MVTLEDVCVAKESKILTHGYLSTTCELLELPLHLFRDPISIDDVNAQTSVLKFENRFASAFLILTEVQYGNSWGSVSEDWTGNCFGDVTTVRKDRKLSTVSI
jgi:hypothetical protein